MGVDGSSIAQSLTILTFSGIRKCFDFISPLLNLRWAIFQYRLLQAQNSQEQFVRRSSSVGSLASRLTRFTSLRSSKRLKEPTSWVFPSSAGCVSRRYVKKFQCTSFQS